MKQGYPTREEVDWVKAYIKTWAFRQDRERLEKFCDAYLAQEEELRGLERGFCEKIEKIGDLVVNAQLLQAENEALRAQLTSDTTEQKGTT